MNETIVTKGRRTMLSSKSNPFNPFKDFEKWYDFDLLNDKCCAILARVAKTSPELSDEMNNIEIENAIDSLLQNDPENRFIKVIDE